jgi:hypothetical protein
MPAEEEMIEDDDESLYDWDYLHDQRDYFERLDAAMVHYKTDKVTEQCVQRAIADMIKSKGIICHREATPCENSRVRMDLSGANYIVEVKMTTKDLHKTIAQLNYYADKKPGEKRLFIAVHDSPRFDALDEDVWECDEYCITLVNAAQCARFVDCALRHDNLLDGYKK